MGELLPQSNLHLPEHSSEASYGDKLNRYRKGLGDIKNVIISRKGAGTDNTARTKIIFNLRISCLEW